jgi:hypothetical protein
MALCDLFLAGQADGHATPLKRLPLVAIENSNPFFTRSR